MCLLKLGSLVMCLLKSGSVVMCLINSGTVVMCLLKPYFFFLVCHLTQFCQQTQCIVADS